MTLSDGQAKKLLEAAAAVRSHAHAPYSHFPVGAAVLDDQGRIHVGCNVENASYPQGTCAEASAIAAMVANGGKRIRAILVIAEGKGLATPCGACRQRISEHADGATPVLVAQGDRVRATFTLGELLPHSFGPESLAR
jgi:cytidine deaminase